MELWRFPVSLISCAMASVGLCSLVFGLLFFFFFLRIKSRGYENLRQYLLYAFLAANNAIFLFSFALLFDAANNIDLLNVANRITIITGMLNVLLALNFYQEFFQYRPKIKIKYFYFSALIFSILTINNSEFFLFKELYQTSKYYTGLRFGIGFQLWGTYLVGISLYTFFILVKLYRLSLKSSVIGERSRQAIFFVVLANVLWIASGILDALTGIQLVDIPPLTWVGSFFVTLSIAGLLIARIEALYEEKDRLYEEVIHDYLTGIYSRSFFETQIGELIKRLQREKLTIHLVLFDIDDFKRINDNYGHLCGDYVLKTIPLIVRQKIRPTDIVARFGGDEFALILFNNSNLKNALSIVNRIREQIASHIFSCDCSKFQLSSSFGLVEINEKSFAGKLTRKEIFTLTDRALYKAKEIGKNAVVWLQAE